MPREDNLIFILLKIISITFLCFTVCTILKAEETSPSKLHTSDKTARKVVDSKPYRCDFVVEMMDESYHRLEISNSGFIGFSIGVRVTDMLT